MTEAMTRTPLPRYVFLAAFSALLFGMIGMTAGACLSYWVSGAGPSRYLNAGPAAKLDLQQPILLREEKLWLIRLDERTIVAFHLLFYHPLFNRQIRWAPGETPGVDLCIAPWIPLPLEPFLLPSPVPGAGFWWEPTLGVRWRADGVSLGGPVRGLYYYPASVAGDGNVQIDRYIQRRAPEHCP